MIKITERGDEKFHKFLDKSKTIKGTEIIESLILINRKQKLNETFDSDNEDHYYGFKSPLFEAQVMCNKEN